MGLGSALVGCDEEHLMPFSEFRAVQQRPTADTLRFIDYVNSEPLIKCLLTGHLHFNHECRLPGGAQGDQLCASLAAAYLCDCIFRCLAI